MATGNQYSTLLFQPFSYERYLAPLMAEVEAYRKESDAIRSLEEYLSDLTTLANTIEAMAMNEKEGSAPRKLYEAYAEALRNQANEMATRGLYQGSRRALLDLKNRFAKDIIPIQTAYNERKADIERQKKLLDTTQGRMVFSRNARTTSLEDYMKGIDEYQLANLDNVFKEGATGALAITSRYFSTSEGKLFKGDYLNLITRQGLSPDEAMQALRMTGKYKDLEDYILKGLSKYSAFGDTPEGQAIHDSFMQGINAGIVYKEDNKPMTNWRLQRAVDDWYDLQKFKREHPETSPAIEGTGYLPYTTVTEVEALESNKTERDKARLFIKNWRADKTGKFLDYKGTTRSAENLGYDPSNDVFSGQKSEIDRKSYWKELTKKYDTKSPQEILKKLQLEERNEIMMYLKYAPNVTPEEKKAIMSTIHDNILFGKDDIKPIEDGKIKSSKEDHYKIIAEMNLDNSNPSIYYSPRLKTWVLSYTSKEDSKVKEYALSPRIINNTTSLYSPYRTLLEDYMDNINTAFEYLDEVNANRYIGDMFKFGVLTPTISKIQARSGTASKEGVVEGQIGSSLTR